MEPKLATGHREGNSEFPTGPHNRIDVRQESESREDSGLGLEILVASLRADVVLALVVFRPSPSRRVGIARLDGRIGPFYFPHHLDTLYQGFCGIASAQHFVE